MKYIILTMLNASVLFSLSVTTHAENRWSNYRVVENKQVVPRPDQHHYGHNNVHQNPYTQHRPYYPQRPAPYPNRPYTAVQNGVNIQYQAPTTINQYSQSYSWVNGDSSAHIESSNLTLITDWQRLGLPAPPSGMYWAYERGRYVLVPNR